MVVRWVGVIGLSILSGCAVARREAPPGFFASAKPVGFQSQVRYIGTDRELVEARSRLIEERARAVSKDGSVHILVLSGGGAAGAFGAGALVGLSRRHERPQYEIVTGVSAGALIAPFAFLGADRDPTLTDAFRNGWFRHLLSPHGPIGVARRGAYRSDPLISLVDHFITRELIEAVAREAATGRLLVVTTTDLDKEETVIWDMGAIAARGGDPAVKLFRQVLVASASIPGLFSPVLVSVEQDGHVYDEMHVDGSATKSMFAAPEAVFLGEIDPAGMKGAQIDALVNGQLQSSPATTRFETGAVLSRSFSALFKHMSRTELSATNHLAQQYGMSLRMTGVPSEYATISSLDFSPGNMRALFDYGADCAQLGLLWTTLQEATTRRSAPAPGASSLEPARGPPARPPCPLQGTLLVPESASSAR